MQVILNVFSGRPDPSWELTSQDASELARRLLGLVPARQTLPESGLGYRGLIVANPDRLAGLPVQVLVFHGIIGIWNDEHVLSYSDRNHLEDWLLELARQQGHGALVDQIIGNKG